MPRGVWKCVLLNVFLLDSFIIHRPAAARTTELQCPPSRALHLHTFHSNSFDTFRLPSATHLNGNAPFFPAHFHYGGTVECPLTTKQTLSLTQSRVCRHQNDKPLEVSFQDELEEQYRFFLFQIIIIILSHFYIIHSRLT